MNEFESRRQKKERGQNVQDVIDNALSNISNTENIVIVMSSKPDEQGIREIRSFYSHADEMIMIGLIEYVKSSLISGIMYEEE